VARANHQQYVSVLDDQFFLDSLRLLHANQFDYLSQSGCFNVAGLDDVASFVETERAANTLGFGQEAVRKLVTLCAAVLHIGNVSFKDTTAADGLEFAEICDDDKSTRALQAASLLLCLDEERLVQGLSSREISIRGERTKVRLTARQSAESRDALAKSMYSNCFDWIVKHVNPTFAAPLTSSGRRSAPVSTAGKENFIGILDIFGFEIFDENSLEQVGDFVAY
jgi:myosin heavy subunit